MERLSRAVLAHRRRAAAAIALLFVAGAGALALLLPMVSERNEYPALTSYRANQMILEVAGTGGYERPVVPVVTLPPGANVDSPATRDALAAAFGAAAAATGGRVLSYADVPDPALQSADGRVSAGLLFGPPREEGGIPGSALGEGAGIEPAAAAAMRPHLPAGATVHVTGLDALATGTDTGGLDVPVKLGVTAVAALAVLVWMFRSRLAAVPLLTAFVAIPSAFLGLLAVSPLITVHETTVIMLPLFGLAIAVDYALIVVARWREERAAGRVGDDAVHRAMATAGHTVMFSAAAVGAGLTALIVLPIPLLRSLGVGAGVVTATSAVVTLVLLPLLLSRLGRGYLPPEEDAAGSWWSGWARTVVRFRGLAALASAGVLVALSAVALGINLHVPASADLATSGPGHTGLVALRDGGVPAGLLTAFDVFVPPGVSPAAVAATLAGVAGVALAAPAVTGPNGAVVTVVPQDEGGTAAGRATVERVLDAAPDGVLVGGNVTQQLEYLDATYATFPLVLALVGLVTLVTLAIAFRSPLLAVKAVLVNLLSLGAVLGALVVLWQWGWGTEALLGIRPDGAIGTFVPVTVFAFLYGLTTDYQMIILARVREEYERGGSTREAVVRGLARSGRLVTGAGMILFFSFAAMASGGELDVAIFASGVALGVLIDATLVRAVLVPASIALLGRWNWWWPRRLTNHRQPGKIGVTQP